MELNSIEAIKNAVQSGLGASFVSVTAIEKELKMGILHRAYIEEVKIHRTLSVIVNSNRYRSKAAEAFIKEILPQFSSDNYLLQLQKLSTDHKEYLGKKIEIKDGE